MNYSANDYAYMARIRVHAFEQIARGLGKDHTVTKMMGTLAHGRHKNERGPDQQGLRDCVGEMAFLDGFFDCLNLWARDNDRAAQVLMLKHWPNGFRKAP